VELRTKTLTNICKGKHVCLKVYIMEFPACGDVEDVQNVQQVRMVLLLDLFLFKIIVVVLLVLGHCSSPEVVAFHCPVGVGNLLQEKLEPIQGCPISNLTDPRVVHRHVRKATGEVTRGSFGMGLNEVLQRVLHKLQAIQEHDFDIPQAKLDATNLLGGLCQDIKVEGVEVHSKVSLSITLKPCCRSSCEGPEVKTCIHEACQPQDVEVMVIASAIVSEDPQLLGCACLCIAGTAQCCSIFSCVVVVVLALDDILSKVDTTVLAAKRFVEGFLVSRPHDELLLILPAKTPIHAEPQQLAHECKEGVIASITDKDLGLELLRDSETLTSHSMHANACNSSVLPISLQVSVSLQVIEEGLDVCIDHQLVHESVVPVPKEDMSVVSGILHRR